ncbi:MAG: hypothetical protein AAB288_04505, partial [Acidobacteriota bacterium]
MKPVPDARLPGPMDLLLNVPETGALQWKWYAVPMEKGDPGLETWASLDAARHGGGHMWVPGSY